MRIIINGIEWNIYTTTDTNNLMRDDGSITLGVTDTVTNTVYIWKNLDDALFRKVLIHELSHVFIHSYGYTIGIDEEEFICMFISTYGEDIINTVAWLLSTMEEKFS